MQRIQAVIKLSLIPNCTSKKFELVDIPKDLTVELRCLPAVELYIALPDFYPSSGKPLMLMTTPFYEPFKRLLYEKLEEKWTQDQLVLYEQAVFLQDEFLNIYFEEGNESQLKINDKGNVQITFNSSAEFQKVFEQALAA